MEKCDICGTTLTCPKCRKAKEREEFAKSGGKASVKKRFAGLSKKEISEMMSKVRTNKSNKKV